MPHKPYPLEWPIGKPRSIRRKASDFRSLTFARTRDDIIGELRRFHARDVVLSTNVPLRRDALPYAGMPQPDDPGVAIYFSLKGNLVRDPVRYYAIACDVYRKVEENMRALVHTIDAMRTIERHGSSQLLEQAMSGFAAIAPPNDGTQWWFVLGFQARPSVVLAEQRYRELVQENHPDHGGSTERMIALNDAIERARKGVD